MGCLGLENRATMDFIDDVRVRSSRFARRIEHLDTEEATKTSLVMPFIQMLGYSIFDPTEVVPEFTADFGNRKGEKVDYALMQDGQPAILIEAKMYGTPLNVGRESQLFRYFTATNARFGVLTDGIIYRFYSDLVEPKAMDQSPFLEFNMLSFTDEKVEELKRFRKDNFDIAGTVEAARELKYMGEIKQVLAEEMNEPSEDFIRFILLGIEYPRLKTAPVLRQFAPIVRQAFSQFVNDRIDARLKSALERDNELRLDTDEQAPEPPPASEQRLSLPLNVFMTNSKGSELASARMDEEGIVVLAGSTARQKTTTSCPQRVLELREAMLRDGRLANDGSLLGDDPVYILRQDHRFDSSSGAASFIAGSNTSGLRRWKDSEGRALGDLQKGKRR